MGRERKQMNADERKGSSAATIWMGWNGQCFTLHARLIIPCPPELVFPFFADAGNLESITPPWLRFQILTPLPIEMRRGTLIEYRLGLHGIALRWLTEITLWEPPHCFIDEQKHGPYRRWVHEHTFAECDAGCEMRDYVRYAPPGGWLADRLFVRRNVRRIFEFRAQKLIELFA
jgi:ligand-binding SRPBCC domain-containing protein